MKIEKLELTAGCFILAGIITLVILALKVSGLSLSTNTRSYHLYASFDNIGTLKKDAKITMAGVIIGKVSNISLDKQNYMAKVDMTINEEIDNIPDDSTAAIVTAGILGEKYISIDIGGSNTSMKNGSQFDDTQSAIIVEELIGKFLMNSIQ